MESNALVLETRIDATELERLLQQVDPAVKLVDARVLRRIMKRRLDLPGLGLQIPHRKSIVLSRDDLLACGCCRELGLEEIEDLPGFLILLVRPDSDRLASLSREEALLKYWRLLFHATIHRELEAALRQSKLTSGSIRERIASLGESAFCEIKQVLGQERYLLEPGKDDHVYVEFSALYWELHFFAPGFLAGYFPALADHRLVEQVLSQDLDARSLLLATRPSGAPEIDCLASSQSITPSEATLESQPQEDSLSPEPEARDMLVRLAARARARGNVVRAAMLDVRAEARASGKDKDALARSAARDLDRLCARLQRALGFHRARIRNWRDALEPLLRGAARGLWPLEARLLYDLQKVCIDSERKVHTVDVIGWLTSFGRRRIVRLLPHHQEVMLLKHLRRAAHRITAVRVGEESRKALADLLEQSIEHAEKQLREQVRPLLLETLRKAGMIPGNYLERIALEKLVEELLDFVVERGYLNMGDLRDAISRNNLKISDLSSLGDLVRGDLLLRSSRRLRDTLDGVYHHGEFYLRWMQRLSSIAFGTALGRFLTLALILPFGGSYVILHGLHHIVSLVTQVFVNLKLPHTSNTSVLVLGAFFVALINFAGFRRQAIRFARYVGQALHALFVELPALLFRLPVVQRILASRIFRWCRDFVLKPMAIAAILNSFFPLYGFSARTTYVSACTTFLLLSILLNTFLGRQLEEALIDAVARMWRRLHLDVFPAILRFVLDLFRQMLEGIERFLYTVDEWLRFRTGENRLSLVLKGMLGIVWFFVTYVVRVYVNLFIEPTFNPIKHFPVVTVGAKLILPFIHVIMPILALPFLRLGEGVAYSIASINFFLIPGFFGFLLWELKENWRLYEANRSPKLLPSPIGHHGETMVRLLRPGFHSGTIPKTFARMRRALRKTNFASGWKAVHRQEETFHYIVDRLRKFAEREFIALLNGCRYRDELYLRLERVSVSTNQVCLEFVRQSEPEQRLSIAFLEQCGWLMVGVETSAWIENLAAGPAKAIRAALHGFYKLAGVDLLEEELKRLVDPMHGCYELSDGQIKIWPNRCSSNLVTLELREGQLLPSCETLLIANQASELLFRNTPILWRDWVETWHEFAAPPANPAPILTSEEIA